MHLEIWDVFVHWRFIALVASRGTWPFIPFLIGTDPIAELKEISSSDLFEGGSWENAAFCVPGLDHPDSLGQEMQ